MDHSALWDLWQPRFEGLAVRCDANVTPRCIAAGGEQPTVATMENITPAKRAVAVLDNPPPEIAGPEKGPRSHRPDGGRRGPAVRATQLPVFQAAT
jgi:hypothetical protein